MIVLYILLTVVSLTNSQSTDMLLRLNNRFDDVEPSVPIREGRVEVSLDGGQTWGTICATNWSYREANVVCKQLNLGNAAFSKQTQQYGTSERYPWSLVGILCRGTEDSLSNCSRERQDSNVCTEPNRNIAVVKCVENIPDLSLLLPAISKSAFLDIQPLSGLTCALEENCLARDAHDINLTQPTALRKLLRFSTTSENVGSADFSPYAHNEQWQWHQCHKHFHSMESFASFQIFNLQHEEVAPGSKASFCLMDSNCKPGITSKYGCGNNEQGISVGCSDTYGTGLDCQWVDVTNLPSNRTYILRVAINPDYMISESSFENNAAECILQYTGERSTTILSNCTGSPLWFNNKPW